MPITVTPTAIPDVLVIEPKVFGDDRGWFFESFNEKEFSAAIGKEVSFVQDNHSSSKKGVLRGLHYQLEQTQGKLVRVSKGAVFDVAVDLRQSSPTFGKWVGVELSAENQKQMWVPEGFAHGFLVLSDDAEFLYKTTDYWHPSSEQCLMWNDPTLKIMWPDLGFPPILNAKDLQGLSWTKAKKYS
jgi:dTDP-4-dehydrorhamnose 3,5-epimerase